MNVEVRCFGDQNSADENLVVEGFSFDNENLKSVNSKLQPILKTLNTNINMNAIDIDANVVHCHTWYSHFAGIN